LSSKENKRGLTSLIVPLCIFALYLENLSVTETVDLKNKLLNGLAKMEEKENVCREFRETYDSGECCYGNQESYIDSICSDHEKSWVL
jgi:hypothetical protein